MKELTNREYLEKLKLIIESSLATLKDYELIKDKDISFDEPLLVLAINAAFTTHNHILGCSTTIKTKKDGKKNEQ